ncbi:hypothetical protein BBK36DRAFT_1159923 [Trichoderma citrinoviride]|uniref:F-box domain-containing protein n=1 Tax=Trichoderma citrinoviride TaxID=58853 RepID=A0A2T4B8Z2_9HYPO|nr:hypothetical protein BBK36DRAFT_1159923 [Trichoderma citrinoviride]PTB65795.1 hypothetical protein BBK36DRAFT_1159923 [Trichoderma citrinoviride]
MDPGLASGKAMEASAASSSPASADAASSPASASPSSSSPATPSASPDADARIIYGRVDAANEDNIDLLSSVADHGALGRAKLLRPSAAQRRDDAIMQEQDTDAAGSGASDQIAASSTKPSGKPPPLLATPAELIDTILSYLSPCDLAAVSATCRALRQHALSDLLWQPLVQENVPAVQVTSPGPCASFRELYAAHDRVWFLPKYKIWFCDRDLTGKLILVRYDPRRGCIEGYQMVAVSNQSTFQHWSADHDVIIHSFSPVVKLHLDKPVLQFRVQDRQEDGGSFNKRPGANRFADEIPMSLDDRVGGMFSNFMLTKPLSSEEADRRAHLGYPYGNMWPSPVIPANHYVSGDTERRGVAALSSRDRPRTRSQVSNQTFCIRQWMQLTGTPGPLRFMGERGLAGALRALVRDLVDEEAAGVGIGGLGFHIGEELITYSTLDPALYTPTPEKPWRGIWVGDYSGHGCEFLLIHQPDDPPATDAELGVFRDENDSDEAWEQKRLDARVYRGRLEGIKLTGDPNVPRGEYTFVVNDLGPDGLVGTATDAQFAGARMVKSEGHIAATGFLRDKFIESQLILISHDKLAQHWVGFGHISFLQRVNIDQFLTP